MSTEPPLPRDARYQIGEISGKLDIMLITLQNQQAQNEARFTKIEKAQDEQATEIAELKQARSWLIGAGAAVAALGSTVGAALGFKLGGA